MASKIISKQTLRKQQINPEQQKWLQVNQQFDHKIHSWFVAWSTEIKILMHRILSNYAFTSAKTLIVRNPREDFGWMKQALNHLLGLLQCSCDRPLPRCNPNKTSFTSASHCSIVNDCPESNVRMGGNVKWFYVFLCLNSIQSLFHTQSSKHGTSHTFGTNSYRWVLFLKYCIKS